MKTASEPSTEDKPPEPPRVGRKMRLVGSQTLGLLFLMAIPVLALARVFGETVAVASASSSRFDVEVTYPAGLRYRTIEPISVAVRNRSDAPIAAVFLDFDESYLRAFSAVQFTPTLVAPSRAALAALPPGETGRLVGSVQAEQYGEHRGALHVRAAGEEVVVPLATRIFP